MTQTELKSVKYKRKHTMKTMTAMIAAALLPLMAMAQQPIEPLDLGRVTAQTGQPDATKTPLIPSPSWSLVRLIPGPGIPVGSNIIGIEAVTQGGTTTNRWLFHLYQPTTRTTYSWLISIN
jgi:hypothetical protein